MHSPSSRKHPPKNCHQPAAICAILCLLTVTPQLAQAIGPDDLTQYSSRFYTIHTNLPKSQAKTYGLHMDRTFAEYSRRFHSFRRRSRQSMPLYLLQTRSQYIALMNHFGFNASASGGMFFYSKDANGLATWVEGPSPSTTLETLQHEGFHQFAHAYIGRNLPIWVNEGLAEYFGDGLIVGKKMTLGLATQQRVTTVQRAIREATAIEFDQLLDITSEQWHQNMLDGSPRGSLQYHQSWSVAYFLIHGDRGRYRNAFEQYLKLVSTGRHSATAFRQAFRTDNTTAFRKRWEAFVLDLEPDAFTTAVARIRFLGRGLKSLHENNKNIPTTLDNLRKALVRINFRLKGNSHGREIIMSAKDDSMYAFMRPNGTQDQFELLEPEASGLLPRIVARGLRPQPTLIWSKAKNGKLESTIKYK